MATVHLIVDGKEVTARTMILKRHHDVSRIDTWWKVARRTLTGKAVPEKYAAAEVSVGFIRFVCADGTQLYIDRKRSLV